MRYLLAVSKVVAGAYLEIDMIYQGGDRSENKRGMMSASNGLGNRRTNNRNNGELMEQVVSRENMIKAYKRVVSN